MSRIEELCTTSERQVSSGLATVKSGTGGTVERLDEIRFDRAGSPLDRWQFSSDDPKNPAPPAFSSPLECKGGLTMTAPGTHHIDLKLRLGHRACNRLRFRLKIAKNCPESYAYANFRAKSRDGKEKSAWIACDVGNKPSEGRGPDECIIYREPSGDGWAVFDLGLPKEVQNSPLGLEHGLEFIDLQAIRLRGSVSVSPIELYREDGGGRNT